MTPESAEHPDRAREHLIKARNLFDMIDYNDDAGRTAYLAGHHAAQALISERTGRIAKTHEGVNSQFNRLTRGDLRVDGELRRFLAKTYDLKAVADYGAGSGSIVSRERVEEAVATAARFIDVVAALLA